MGKLLQNIVGMRNFQDTFETRKRSFISAFSICMTVPLSLECANPSSAIKNFTKVNFA